MTHTRLKILGLSGSRGDDLYNAQRDGIVI